MSEPPVTATPLPTPLPLAHPVYIVDPNDQGALSNIFLIDPDAQRVVWRLETRFLPEAVLSPDDRHLYVVDSYRTRVTRGEQRDVLSIYDAHHGDLRIEDVPVQGRLLYKGWPSSDHPFVFFSDDGRQLYIAKYGDPDRHQLRLAAYDPETLQLQYESDWPVCGRRIKTLPDRWTCANTSIGLGNSPSAMTFSLNSVDPSRGITVETLFSIPDLPVAGMMAHTDSTRLYVITSDLTVIDMDIQNGTPLEVGQLNRIAGWELDGETMVLAPDGKRLYVGFDTGTDDNAVFTDAISVYDTTTWARVATISLPDSINYFDLSTAGDRLYVVSPSGRSLTIYDTGTYQKLAVMEDLGGSPSTILVPQTLH